MQSVTNNMEKEKRKIDPIERGIVIDHIPAGKVWEIVDILGVRNYSEGKVSIGEGYESSKCGKKGILKIEGKHLSPLQLNLIALVSEDISVSFISGGNVNEKFKVKIPESLVGLVVCPNSNCISNYQQENVPSKIHYNPDIGFSCHYCEREFDKEQLEIKVI
jgi:aspartate carbamoyltransferase regulatory subunit